MDNNSVSWALRLQDFASDSLKKFGGTARDVFGGVDREVNRVERDMRDLGRPITLNVDSSSLRRAHNDIERMHERMGFLATSGAMFVGNMAAQGVSRAINIAEKQIGDVLKGGKAVGAYKSDFKTMAGDEGGALFTDLRQYVKDSPFGPEQYALAQEMLNYGVSVKEILPDLKMFGDITGLNAEKMKLLEYAFSQMSSMGYLRGDDKNQMTGAGFNPLLELERTTGKSMATLMKMMEARQITAQMVRGAFISATSAGGRYHGRLTQLMGTAAGEESAQMGSVEDAKMGLGESLMPAYLQLLKQTRPLVDELPKALAELQPQIESIITGLADMVKWTRTNTETIGTWVSLIKIGAEAWVAWKVGTAVATAANWVWVTSVGAQTAASLEASAAVTAENVVLAEQETLVAALGLSYDKLSASVLGFAASADGAALSAAAMNTGALGMAAAGRGAAATANVGAATLAGGFMGAASKAVLPVAVMYFAGEALGALLPKGVNGESFSLMTALKGPSGMQEYMMSAFVKYQLDNAEPDGHRWAGKHGRGPAWGSAVAIDLNGKVPGNGSGGGSASMASLDAEDIIGGGRKQTVINFRNMVENLYNNVESKEEGMKFTVQDLKIMFNELLAGLPR